LLFSIAEHSSMYLAKV